jgi:hypothetical protein
MTNWKRTERVVPSNDDIVMSECEYQPRMKGMPSGLVKWEKTYGGWWRCSGCQHHCGRSHGPKNPIVQPSLFMEALK